MRPLTSASASDASAQQPGIPGLIDDIGPETGHGQGSEPGALCTGTALSALMTLPGVGAKRAVALAQRFPTWDAFLSATTPDLIPAIGAATAHRLAEAMPTTIPHADLPAGMQVVSIFEPHYPESLRGIPDPPPLLWWQGTLPTQPALAVVGTRTPTPFGRQVAALSAQVAAEHGLPVVSGLALGVDSIAAASGLDHGRPTWAVLGQGIATFPATGDRAALARRILSEGGGLLAEVPPATPVARHLLTRRNRLQSGLSEAVVIAETSLPTAHKPAGTIHTARFAIEQDRLLAVAAPPPGREDDPDLCGNAALVAHGGIDPMLLHVTDAALAARVRARTPAADLVITGPQDLHALCASIRSNATVASANGHGPAA